MKKPSVTQLISQLDKPRLLNWANMIGLQGIHIDKYRQQSLSQGTHWHKQVEEYLKNKTPFTDIALGQLFIEFLQDKEIIASEKVIEHELFTGRLDIKLKWKDQVWICDFKSNFKKPYIENKLQLAAYKMAEPCDKLAIISLPSMHITEIRPNLEACKAMIEALAKVYQFKELV